MPATRRAHRHLPDARIACGTQLRAPGGKRGGALPLDRFERGSTFFGARREGRRG